MIARVVAAILLMLVSLYPLMMTVGFIIGGSANVQTDLLLSMTITIVCWWGAFSMVRAASRR